MKKKVLLLLVVELLASAAFAFYFNGFAINYSFFSGLGVGNLIIGLIGCFFSVVVMFMNKEAGRSILIASGLLLLLGFLTCSFFTSFN